MNLENIPIKDDGMADNTYLKVKEGDTCSHWECTGDEVLAPMHECWYCKHSDFRKDMSRHMTHSMCRCPLNQCTGERKEL